MNAGVHFASVGDIPSNIFISEDIFVHNLIKHENFISHTWIETVSQTSSKPGFSTDLELLLHLNDGWALSFSAGGSITRLKAETQFTFNGEDINFNTRFDDYGNVSIGYIYGSPISIVKKLLDNRLQLQLGPHISIPIRAEGSPVNTALVDYELQEFKGEMVDCAVRLYTMDGVGKVNTRLGLQTGVNFSLTKQIGIFASYRTYMGKALYFPDELLNNSNTKNLSLIETGLSYTL